MFTIEWIEIKSPDWKIVSLKTAQGKVTEGVSVNRVNKKGETFPNFDGITLGATLDGELWQSTAGKWYLFAPKSNLGQKPAWAKKDVSASVEKAQNRTAEMVKTAQERTQEGVAMSGSIRDAVLITTAKMRYVDMTDLEIEAEITKWQKVVYNLHDQPFV